MTISKLTDKRRGRVQLGEQTRKLRLSKEIQKVTTTFSWKTRREDRGYAGIETHKGHQSKIRLHGCVNPYQSEISLKPKINPHFPVLGFLIFLIFFFISEWKKFVQKEFNSQSKCHPKLHIYAFLIDNNPIDIVPFWP